jgi:hypothetical protein
MRRAVPPAFLAAAMTWAVACGSRGAPHIALPTGTGSPTSEYAATLAAAQVHCRDIRSFSAKLSLSGHAGGQKLRGQVLVGLVPGALRLEALAPDGNPAFILVADGERGRLLLARDHRMLEGAPPEDILDALVGVKLAPDDLRALLTGCLRASPEPTGARAFDADWIVVDLEGGGTMYLHRGADASWRVVAGAYAGLSVQYGELVAGVPSQVRITSSGSSGRQQTVDVILGVSQVELNEVAPRDQLVALVIPPGTAPITLQELRESYHR